MLKAEGSKCGFKMKKSAMRRSKKYQKLFIALSLLLSALGFRLQLTSSVFNIF